MSFRSQQSFRLLVGDPSLGHTKPSCLGFLAKLFIPFSIFDKSLHSFCLPTYIHPATHLLPPTHRPTFTHPSTQLLSTYLLTSTHIPTRQSTSTHLHPPNYYLPTYLPTYHHPNTHPPTYLYPPNFSHSPTYIPTYLSTNPTHFSPPTYPPTCLHTTYLYKYLPVPTHLHFYLLTYLPTN